MKKTNKNSLLILIVSIVLGITIAMQFKIINNAFLDGDSPLKRSVELTQNYKELVDEKKRLEDEVDRLENTLSEIEESFSKDSFLIKNLTDELNYYKLIGGFQDVQGPGITIILDNPPTDVSSSFEVNLAYEYELMLLMINELNASGAEAIEINGQRVISISEIRTAGNAININKIPQYAPFIINVIGDKDTLDGSLNQRFGLVSAFREKGYFVETRKSDFIEISRYKDRPRFDYAETIEE